MALQPDRQVKCTNVLAELRKLADPDAVGIDQRGRAAQAGALEFFRLNRFHPPILPPLGGRTFLCLSEPLTSFQARLHSSSSIPGNHRVKFATV